MRLFRGIKNNYKKSEAAVIVQNLLQLQADRGLFESDPASSANKLVGEVWDKSEHLFDGRFGQRPHKLSVAAAALSNAITQTGQHSSPNIFAMCLGTIFSELEVNGRLYPLNSLDSEILDSSAVVLREFSDQFLESPLGRDISGILDSEKSTWEQWLSEYKDEAGKANSSLARNEDGFSLIDIMGDEPLCRAYQDGVEPRGLGRQFGEQFDPLKFGIRS